ncbi:MAG: hypothetical protein AAF298_04920 [Cyanobacteria bacterium P01_A01_bin.40]
MNQRLSSFVLAISLAAMNVLPTHAAEKKITLKQLEPRIILSSGKWCFKLLEMGLFCYVL